MNFRRFAKRLLADAQRLHPTMTTADELLAREWFVDRILRDKGLIGGFYDLNNYLKVRRKTDNVHLRGKPVMRIGRAALKQGKFVLLRRLTWNFYNNIPLHHTRFVGGH